MMVLLEVFLALVVAWLTLLIVWSLVLRHSARQEVFALGSVPSPLPSGFYRGSIRGSRVSWRGKKFDAENNTGFNVFEKADGTEREAYPFKTSVGESLTDTGRDVLRIDYNLPQNRLWFRPILDEVVQIAPDQYLGKLQYRIIPGFPFTFAFFELRRQTL